MENSTIKSNEQSAITQRVLDENGNTPENVMMIKYVTKEQHTKDIENINKLINAHFIGDDKHDEHINVLIDKKLKTLDSKKEAHTSTIAAVISAIAAILAVIVPIFIN